MSDIDIIQIDYLLKGAVRQRKLHELLQNTKILDLLKDHNPIIVGTIPINLDLSESDVDIICEVYDFKNVQAQLDSLFCKLNDSSCIVKEVNGIKRLVANFKLEGWPIEIFGQSIPTTEQNGYKHMIIESRLIKIIGQESFEYIRNLKRKGIKTEPAFATLLKLEGDPYLELLRLFELDEESLRQAVYLKIGEG
ncbi:DUF4269 domain-containing protein [Peribacillus alkalitolerans]|uniref:DUF4269 domain-containing protein n=1 Tax=Peribacillus alkalitolerans TaxID=1550385 RepID=UPI0013D05469|nr:DUF4269 domain-containing protein [Peribacillus alkalitolerans]